MKIRTIAQELIKILGGVALCAVALVAFVGCPDTPEAGPMITLAGNTVTVVAIRDTFADPGFSVDGNNPEYTGTVTATITNSDGATVTAIDTTTAGIYTITYTAPTDAAGVTLTTVTRTVRVGRDTDNDTLIDIYTLDDLNAMRYNLAGTSYRASADGAEVLCGNAGATACIGYELMRDLDFAAGTSYASGETNAAWHPTGGDPDSATNPGWEPIGTKDSPFSGSLSGNGFSISNLYVRRHVFAGLFGVSGGDLEGIGLVNARVYGGGGRGLIGGLAGQNDGTITASYVLDGIVNGGTGAARIDLIGGLVGANTGTIIASYATVDVDRGAGINTVGGLVGVNNDTGVITASYATGAVSGDGTFESSGGLVGQSIGTITASYATGDVGGDGGNNHVGGLIGVNSFEIEAGTTVTGTETASYGFGTVTIGERGTTGVARSTDAALPATVTDACAITRALSSMTPANRWDAAQWDFGTDMQRPFVRHNGALVPGQTDRGC